MKRPEIGSLTDKLQAEVAFREVLGWILKTDDLSVIKRLAHEALDAYPGITVTNEPKVVP